jgi:hypothetical protein
MWTGSEHWSAGFAEVSGSLINVNNVVSWTTITCKRNTRHSRVLWQKPVQVVTRIAHVLPRASALRQRPTARAWGGLQQQEPELGYKSKCLSWVTTASAWARLQQQVPELGYNSPVPELGYNSKCLSWVTTVQCLSWVTTASAWAELQQQVPELGYSCPVPGWRDLAERLAIDPYTRVSQMKTVKLR